MSDSVLIKILGELHKIIDKAYVNGEMLPEKMKLNYETKIDNQDVIVKTVINVEDFLEKMSEIEEIVLGDKSDIECNCPKCKFERELKKRGEEIITVADLDAKLFKN